MIAFILLSDGHPIAVIRSFALLESLTCLAEYPFMLSATVSIQANLLIETAPHVYGPVTTKDKKGNTVIYF